MKNVFAIICTLCLTLSVALPSHAGGGRPSFSSSRSSFSGGFRSSSSPSYRSFSASPSRSYTYKSNSAPAATRPTYSYSTPVQARPISRSTVKKTTINNHYHGDGGHSGGGGLSMTDYLVLHSLTNHSPTYVSAQPAVIAAQPVMANAPMGSYDAPAVMYQQEESHFWRNFFLFILCLAVVGCIVVGIVHYLETDTD
jgi:hypothetical protein